MHWGDTAKRIRAGVICSVLFMLGCGRQPPEPPEPSPSVSTIQPGDEESVPSAQQYDSRYEQPTSPEPAPVPTAPLGHAVAIAGYDLTDPTRPRLAWMDPADNLIDGRGVHRWAATPYEQTVQRTEYGPIVEIDGRVAHIFGMVVIESHRPYDTPPPARLIHEQMPDLSQHAGQRWENLCGPTAAADALYSLRSSDPGLMAYLPIAPVGLADTAASQCIAGPEAPPMLAGSLAKLMHSTLQGGTSAENMVTGLRTYLAANATSADTWGVRFIATDATASESNTLDLIQRVIAGGGAVILTLNWVNTGEEEVGDPLQLSESEIVHNSTVETMSNSTPDDHDSTALEPSGATATDRREDADLSSHGTLPATVPSQATFDGRLSNEIDVEDDIGVPLAPAAVNLPPIRGVSETLEAPTVMMTARALHGRWEQTAGENSSDFAPGGYGESELSFGRDGILRVTRRFGEDNTIVLTQQFLYEFGDDQILVIKSMGDSPKASRGFVDAAIDNWTDGQGSSLLLPAEIRFTITDLRLELMHKSYQRMP